MKVYNGTASALVKKGMGKIYSIVVNSHSSGTIKLYDYTEGSGLVMFDTVTLGAAERLLDLKPGVSFNTGLYIATGGTINYSIIYE